MGKWKYISVSVRGRTLLLESRGRDRLLFMIWCLILLDIALNFMGVGSICNARNLNCYQSCYNTVASLFTGPHVTSLFKKSYRCVNTVLLSCRYYISLLSFIVLEPTPLRGTEASGNFERVA